MSDVEQAVHPKMPIAPPPHAGSEQQCRGDHQSSRGQRLAATGWQCSAGRRRGGFRWRGSWGACKPLQAAQELLYAKGKLRRILSPGAMPRIRNLRGQRRHVGVLSWAAFTATARTTQLSLPTLGQHPSWACCAMLAVNIVTLC